MEPPKPEPSLSDTSSIISAPPCPPIKPNQPEGEEQQQPQEQEEDANHDLVLDLSLCNKDSDHGSKPELNLIDCFKTNITDAMDRAPEGNETEPRVFSCNYCQRKFYSSQALGGHQNAHKRERTLAKRGHRLGSAASSLAFGHPNRYSSMSSLPLHGSFNRSLGIQAHAMISKPSYISSTIGSSHIYGRNSWPRRPINQQPAIGRLAPENSHLGTNIGASSPTGAARFDSLLKFSPVSEDISGYWWDSVARLKTKQDELKKLDLSLKL